MLIACAATADEPQPIFVPWSGSPYAASYQPEDIDLGDFDGDGHLDIATSSTQGFVGLLLGQRNHTFVAAQGSPFYTTLGFIRSVKVADFNEDGYLDVAGVDTAASSILVMNGDGSGALTPALGSPFPAGSWAWHMALGDFNRDEHVDIAIADPGANTALIALNDGAGNFPISLQQSYPVGANPVDILVVDLTDDGYPDIITADYNQGALTVLLNDGDGRFHESVTQSSDGYWPERLVAADFNEDGEMDVACVNEASQSLAIFLGDGHGNLIEVGPPIDIPYAWSLAVADVDGDGHIDLTVGGRSTPDLYLLTGDGHANFSMRTFEGLFPESNFSLLIAHEGGSQVIASSFFDGTVHVLQYLDSDRLLESGFD
jgi:hypothetical protein